MLVKSFAWADAAVASATIAATIPARAIRLTATAAPYRRLPSAESAPMATVSTRSAVPGIGRAASDVVARRPAPARARSAAGWLTFGLLGAIAYAAFAHGAAAPPAEARLQVGVAALALAALAAVPFRPGQRVASSRAGWG